MKIAEKMFNWRGCVFLLLWFSMHYRLRPFYEYFAAKTSNFKSVYLQAAV